MVHKTDSVTTNPTAGFSNERPFTDAQTRIRLNRAAFA